MKAPECQIDRLGRTLEGKTEELPLPFRKRVVIQFLRYLSPRTRRTLRISLKRFVDWSAGITRKHDKPPAPQRQTNPTSAHLKAAGLVRVRSEEEIRATLDPHGRLKGCGFMSEMGQYCGTTQRVFRPVDRFFDERDVRVKKSKGLVLLEGLMCQGTEWTGPCDRSCFYFWREEWLEKVD